jgi:hypothetical protein
MAPDSALPPGEWNSCDIVAHDGAVEVRINGVVQNTATKVEPSFGRIGFQLEGAACELRKVAMESASTSAVARRDWWRQPPAAPV